MNYDSRIDAEAGDKESASFNPLEEIAEDAQRSRRKTIIFAIAVALILVLIWFLLHRSDRAALSDAAANQAPTMTVVEPGRTTVAATISATGSLAARRELPIGSVGEGGQVSQVLVEPGQWVRQGQTLAIIDRSVQTQQANGLAAQIQVAAADARLAQANLDRALRLVDRGFISKADVDRLTATRDAANARVRVAGAQLGELQARIRRLDILAPADGLLLERNVEPGQVVGTSSGVLFRIAKGGEMEMLANLSESDLASLAVGVSVDVTPVGTDKSFSGQVWQLSPMIDAKTRQGSVRIALAYAPELRPGGFATATIRSGTIVAPILPEFAILSDNRGSFVYVIGKGNKAERRSVKIGTVTEKGIAVTDGLSGNERVILRAGGFLSPGETVNPKLAPKP